MTTRRQGERDTEVKQDTMAAVKQGAEDAAEAVKENARTFKKFMEKFYHDWSFHLTQALTFALVSSLLPMSILLLVIVGDIIGDLNTKAKQQFIERIQQILPPPLSSSAHDIIVSAFQKLPQSSIFTVVGIIAALFFGSRLFTLLEACLDIIYRVPQRPFKKKNGLALVMVLLFMIVAPLLVLTSLIPGAVLSILQDTPLDAHPEEAQRIAGIIGSFLVSFLLYQIIYMFVPNRKGSLRWKMRTSWRGSLVGAIALQICLLIFPLYAQIFEQGLVGQITFALVLLIFFYIISLVTLIGATVNAYFAEGIVPTANDLVTRSSQSN